MSAVKLLDNYVPGTACTCHAHADYECACDADLDAILAMNVRKDTSTG
jgi:hypothetical protein